jgi:hypothetical protein
MEYDDEKCLNLIKTYRKKPLFWDPNDRNYYQKHLNDDAWAEIGVAMHTTGSGGIQAGEIFVMPTNCLRFQIQK